MRPTPDLSPFSDPVSKTVLPACGIVLTDVCLLPVGEKHDVSFSAWVPCGVRLYCNRADGIQILSDELAGFLKEQACKRQRGNGENSIN